MSATWPYRCTGTTALIGLPVRLPERPAGCGSFAQPLQVLVERIRAHAVRPRVDVDELRRRRPPG